MDAIEFLATMHTVLALIFIITAPFQQDALISVWFFANAAIFLALAAMMWNLDLLRRIRRLEDRIAAIEGEDYEVLDLSEEGL